MSSHSYSFPPTPKETELHLTYYLLALCTQHTFIQSVVGTSFQKVAEMQLCYQKSNSESKMRQMLGYLTN